VPKTAPKSPNSSASVLKTSSHKRRRWKTAKHCFFGFLRNVSQNGVVSTENDCVVIFRD